METKEMLANTMNMKTDTNNGIQYPTDVAINPI